MEAVIPRRVGLENVTTGSPGPHSGVTGGSQLSWVTIASKTVSEFDCIGNLDALSPESGVLPGEESKNLQMRREEPIGPPTLAKASGWGQQKARIRGQEIGRNE